MKKSPTPFAESPPSVLAEIRLIATDMDGTLTQRGQFTPALLQTLTQLAQSQRSTLIVTGRSAGWVQGIVSYLPVIGAIAENGGIFIPKDTLMPVPLVEGTNSAAHRTALAQMFAQLQASYPALQPSADNEFRLTDWTFDIQDLTAAEVSQMAHLCAEAGWGFTYSTVQCHIRPPQQDKGIALTTVLQRYWPHLRPQNILTVGDSPNDEGLFEAQRFPFSVGVANVAHYGDRLRHLPGFITQGEEVVGFQELAMRLLAVPVQPSR